MSSQVNAYNELEKIFQQYVTLDNIGGLLMWDNSVLMPAKGSSNKMEQVNELGKIKKNLLRSNKVNDLIKASEDANLNNWQAANLKVIKRIYDNEMLIDDKLREERTNATVKCELAWREAKEKDNFNILKPLLKQVVKLIQQGAKLKADKLGVSEYDALIHGYDNDANTKNIDRMFSNLESTLKGLLPSAIRKQQNIVTDDKLLSSLSIRQQKMLIKKVMKLLQFDFSRGRCDESAHPFCSGVRDDTRVTVRYNPNNFLDAFMAVTHETGHAVYIQNLPQEWRRQPVGTSYNMTLHESQSLFCEFFIASNHKFIEFITPSIQKYIPYKIKSDDIFNLINKVKLHPIRIESDEFTYPLHIIHRYKMEKGIIDGSIDIEHLPDAWNTIFHDIFGYSPSSDKTGCLQDIHWNWGSFGYFPTYCLGAILSAQLFNKFQTEFKSQSHSSNEPVEYFTQAIKWLNENVHQYGSLYSTNELAQKVLGQPLDEKDYIGYLKNKYT